MGRCQMLMLLLTQAIAAHAKTHKIAPGKFKRLTHQEIQAIRVKNTKQGPTDNQPQPKGDGGKSTNATGNNGKGANGNGDNGNGKEGDGKPATGKGGNGKKGNDKGARGGKKRTRAQPDDDDDDEDYGDDELLNPSYLRSPKRKRGKVAAPGDGQPPRQSKRTRRAPAAP